MAAEHAPYNPTAEATHKLFADFQSDPKFVRLCKLQRCFRARVSPKPWRCAHKALNKTEGGRVRPVPESRRTAREAWVTSYQSAAESYASCRLVAIVGGADPDPRLTGILNFHDRLAQVKSKLPLA